MRSHHTHREEPPKIVTRRQLLALGALTGLPMIIWLRSGGASGSPIAPPTTADSSPPAAQAAPPITTTVRSGSATATVSQLDHELGLGMSEATIEVLQARLHELGFDPGPVDGYFGESTLRAVWAFEKLVERVARDDTAGVVTPALWKSLHRPSEIAPRRTPGGTHLEVYLPEQVAVLFASGRVQLVSHVSSGQGIEWCDEVTVDNDDGTQDTVGICGLSITPGGVYHFERKVAGWRNAKLGRLYKPVYFNYGIAIHGASNVPNYPASRGCVRFPMHIAEYIQDLVSIGDAVYVFDGQQEPEHYGAQPMIFDWADPDYATTTTSTTTTTTTSSPPAATSPPATTTVPSSAAPTTVQSTMPPSTDAPTTTVP